MTLARAAWFAAVGALAKGVYYTIANLMPSWSAPLAWDVRLALVIVAVIDPLVWAAYFACVGLKREATVPAYLGIVVSLLQVVLSGARQYTTFSMLSLDTIEFVFGGAIPAVCWSLVLLAQARSMRLPRASVLYLLLLGMFQIALHTYTTGNSYPTIRDFGREAPFQLIVTPAIWMLYWVTLTLYVIRLYRPGQAVRA